MKIDGRCHCGFIAFEAEAEPDAAMICNCTDCQVLTGGAFRVTVPSKLGSFRLLSGEPTRYIKTADSGNRREHAFCPHCGSPIWATSLGDDPKAYSLRFGNITQRAAFTPSRQIFARSQPAWVNRIDEIPRSETV